MTPAALLAVLALLLSLQNPSEAAVLVCAQEPPIEFVCVLRARREAAAHQES